MKRVWSLIFLITSLFIFSACLDTGRSSSASVASNPVSPDFPGAQKATNLASATRGSIRIEWNASTAADTTGYAIYQIDSSTGALQEIARVDPGVTAYVHSDLDLNKAYSYVVRFTSASGGEDKNKVIVSSITYVGMNDPIYSFVESINSTTLKAYLKPTTGDFNEVRIYAAPLRDPDNLKLAATVAAGVDNATLTGLKSGVTYRVIARAYSASLRAEDGNNVDKLATTSSNIFGNPRDTIRSYRYRGFSSVQAFGEAPNAPAVKTPNATPYYPNNTFWSVLGDRVANPAYVSVAPVYQPRTAQVRLTWLPFQGADRNTKYKLIRVRATGQNGTAFVRPDFATSTACSSTTNASCVVCDDGDTSLTNNCEIAESANPASAFKSALDTNVQKPATSTIASPAGEVHYYYAVTAYNLGTTGVCPNDCWYEEFDSTDDNDYKHFAIKVSIPPANMALVQRDAVNYEMCELMGRQSDPLNYQRCLYSGMGAKPIDSGKTNSQSITHIPDGYYDFGYNLLYDRWEVGCQWTRGNGKCSGANSDSSVGCFGDGSYSDPNLNRTGNAAGAVSGVDGDVLFVPGPRTNPTTQNCYAYVGSKPAGQRWVPLRWTAALPVTTSTIQAALSPDPRNMDVPPLASVTSPKMNGDICNATGTVYGSKRLPRLREFRAAAGWARVPGDEYSSVALSERKSTFNSREYGLFEASQATLTFTPANPSYVQPVYNGCNTFRRGVYASAWNPIRKTFINTEINTPFGMAPSTASYKYSTGLDFSTTLVKGTPGAARTLQDMLSPSINWEGVASFTTPASNYAALPTTDTFMYNEFMMIGSTGTSNCTSRFGIQDIHGNAPEILSDQVGCTGDGTCKAWPSNMIDAKNNDLTIANYAWNGVKGPKATDLAGTACPVGAPLLGINSQVNYGATTVVYNSGSPGAAINFFSVPLGLPLISSSEYDGLDVYDNRNAVTFGTYTNSGTAPYTGRLGHFRQRMNCAVGVSGETTATLPMNIFAGGMQVDSTTGASPEIYPGGPGRFGLGFTPYGINRNFLGFRCAQPAD